MSESTSLTSTSRGPSSRETSPLAGLEPRAVWEAFDGLRRVPRPPGEEERVVAHVVAWAEAHGFAHRRDAGGNLVVAVPASEGSETAATVVLQAHLDMVCERAPGVDHDFARDPIDVVVEDGWVRARGTTLGADNGLGAALAMAVAGDPAAVHGPLELLFTLEEEVGLLGAARLDPELVTGRLLVNLDSEEDDAVYVGCAGAGGVEAELPLVRRERPAAGDRYRLRVGGLRGGHSGMEIVENRGNAPQILARVLVRALDAGVDLALVDFAGGSKGNAIPRDAVAEVSLEGSAVTALREVVDTVSAELREELGAADPDLEIALEPAGGPAARQPLDDASRDRLLRLVVAVPHGVRAMSREIPGLVETSANLAVVETSDHAARVHVSCRSSVAGALAATRRGVRALVELAGGRARELAGYPGWRPRPESPLVQRTVRVHRELFGEAPAVRAVHAGLECGILVEKLPGLDAVSIGPEIRGAHSPHERARVASVGKLHRWLAALLADLADG